ncbi:ATP-binding protein [Chitinilyticum litopenaei]|uniref:ATP-binding protein n=1 Tax=Chitinilyticum litopenaei TaxID=1121276 RepID=UPI000419C7AC|nr:ATP-binding protein [Chitinilyticum litopenaei]
MDAVDFSIPFVIPAPAQAELDAIRAILNNHKQEAIRRCEALTEAARRDNQAATLIAAAELYGLVVPQYGRDTLFEALQLACAYHWQPAEARLCEQIARSFYTTGDYRPARQYWQRCIDLARLPGGEPSSWIYGQIGLGQVHDALGEHAAAVRCHRAALAHCGALDDTYLRAKIRINLATNLLACENHAEAGEQLRQALAECRTAQLLDYAAESLFRLGELARLEQRPDEAEAHFREALRITRDISYHWAETNTLRQLSLLAAERGDLGEARRLCNEGIGLAELIGYNRQRLDMLLEAAAYAEQESDINEAYRLLRAYTGLLPRPQEVAQEQHYLEPASQQKLLQLASHSLIDSNSTSAALALLLQEAPALLAASGASLWLLGPHFGMQCVQRGTTAAPDSIAATHSQALALHVQQFGQLNACLARQHPLLSALLAQWPEQSRPSSILLQAIREGDTHWLLWVENTQARRNWLPDDEAILQRLTAILQRILARQQQQALSAELEEINAALQRDNRALAEHVAQRGAALQQALAQLAHSERMAATGRLMAGMAHELNTPLGIARTAASTISNELAQLVLLIRNGRPQRDEVLQILEQCHAATTLTDSNILRAAELVQRFRVLGGQPEQEDPADVDVSALLQGVCQLYREQIAQGGHVLLLDVPARLPWRLRPAALQQVLSQLLGNILEHAFRPGQSGRIELGAQAGPASLRLLVRDNGIGMSEDAVQHAFDPFYLSRLGSGGGLGLYGAYNLVSGPLGGQIGIRSRPGEFTEVQLDLPAST